MKSVSWQLDYKPETVEQWIYGNIPQAFLVRFRIWRTDEITWEQYVFGKCPYWSMESRFSETSRSQPKSGNDSWCSHIDPGKPIWEHCASLKDWLSICSERKALSRYLCEDLGVMCAFKSLIANLFGRDGAPRSVLLWRLGSIVRVWKVNW